MRMKGVPSAGGGATSKVSKSAIHRKTRIDRLPYNVFENWNVPRDISTAGKYTTPFTVCAIAFLRFFPETETAPHEQPKAAKNRLVQ